MYSVDQLITASKQELNAILSTAKVAPQGDQNARRDRIAQQLGLNSTQLVCGVGFNPVVVDHFTVVHYLGFGDYSAFVGERNYQLIHDRYERLSVNNVLEIYRVLGDDDANRATSADLVMTRLTTIESQLEETINPILIGGYKLEIRGIYENRLASSDFLEARLRRSNAVLRDIANELPVILETNTLNGVDFLRHEGVTTGEKARAVRDGLVDADVVREFLNSGVDQNVRDELTAVLNEN